MMSRLLGERGEHDHPDLGVRLTIGGSRRPRPAGHRQVHEHDVGLALATSSTASPRRPRSRRTRCRGRREQLGAPPHHRVVVGDQHPDHLIGTSRQSTFPSGSGRRPTRAAESAARPRGPPVRRSLRLVAQLRVDAATVVGDLEHGPSVVDRPSHRTDGRRRGQHVAQTLLGRPGTAGGRPPGRGPGTRRQSGCRHEPGPRRGRRDRRGRRRGALVEDRGHLGDQRAQCPTASRTFCGPLRARRTAMRRAVGAPRPPARVTPARSCTTPSCRSLAIRRRSVSLASMDRRASASRSRGLAEPTTEAPGQREQDELEQGAAPRGRSGRSGATTGPDSRSTGV